MAQKRGASKHILQLGTEQNFIMYRFALFVNDGITAVDFDGILLDNVYQY